MSRLILFITGDSPRSMRAKSNLARALDSLNMPHLETEIVDLIEQPDCVVEHSVFATPALKHTNAKGKPGVIYGDLSDTGKLEDFLSGLNG